MNFPDITIAIPTRNRAELLIDAVNSALAQKLVNIEVLVSDNASDDNTQSMLLAVKDPRLKVFRQSKLLSMAENWNFCLTNARGRLFLLLSDDDVLLPDAAVTFFQAFDSERVKLACSRVYFVGANGVISGISCVGPEYESGESFIRNSLDGKRQVLPSATMHYTADAVAIGGYPEIGNTADLAMRLALASRGDIYCSPTPLCRYRIHTASLTADVMKTIDSVNLFWRWVSTSSALLSAWIPAAQIFCRDFLRARAFSSAVRGDRKSALEFLFAAKQILRCEWYDSILICLLASPPVRRLAFIRRELKDSRLDCRLGNKL